MDATLNLMLNIKKMALTFTWESHAIAKMAFLQRTAVPLAFRNGLHSVIENEVGTD